MKNRPSYYWKDFIKLSNTDSEKIKLQKVKFSKCDIFLLSYDTEIGGKLLKICLDRTYEESSPGLFCRPSVDPIIIAVFDNIKKEINIDIQKRP